MRFDDPSTAGYAPTAPAMQNQYANYAAPTPDMNVPAAPTSSAAPTAQATPFTPTVPSIPDVPLPAAPSDQSETGQNPYGNNTDQQ